MEITHKEQVEQAFRFYDQTLDKQELLRLVTEQRKLNNELRDAIEELRLRVG
jgi:hypothetical protein